MEGSALEWNDVANVVYDWYHIYWKQQYFLWYNVFLPLHKTNLALKAVNDSQTKFDLSYGIL